jgi:hypothetical protein
MKVNGIFLTVTCLVILLSAKGQHEATSSALKFQSNLQTGILIGQKGSSAALSLNLINGLQQKSWFAGIGVGIDYGSKRSIPLFLDVKKYFSKGNNGIFVYADAGHNFGWLNSEQKTFLSQAEYKSSGNYYYETGIGYRFLLRGVTAMGVNVGYSVKQFRETYTNNLIIEPPITGTATNTVNFPPASFTNTFNRLSLKLNLFF